MVKPYYEQDGIAIYHGDCRELVAHAGPVDAVLTDPPYGINAARARNSQRWGWRDYVGGEWDRERPDADLLRLVVSSAPYAVVWGGNYFVESLPPLPAAKWLIWDKGQTDFSLADCEMAWCSWEGAIRRLAYARGTALKDGKQHPTQKPEALMAWCLSQFPVEPKVVLDPFMGSGTTLVACKRLGLRAIGIEREEQFCEVAASRLAQGGLFAAGGAA
jgi:DNA modification methylase